MSCPPVSVSKVRVSDTVMTIQFTLGGAFCLCSSTEFIKINPPNSRYESTLDDYFTRRKRSGYLSDSSKTDEAAT
ncbi:hypothetical protein J45TS6_22840 [Paenibacillus sp. J45TS6]|nr:hypothetical protein J45TS6_22840 [Paenibacillus sp. J45TS6]